MTLRRILMEVLPGRGALQAGVALVLVIGQFKFTQAEAESPDIPPQRTVFVNTTAPAVPGAQEIVLDLPSALHWPRHQRGQIGPWVYVLFPDGSARLTRGGERAQIEAGLSCQSGVGCDITMTEAPDIYVPVGSGAKPALPADDTLETVTGYLARWILAGTAPDLPPAPVPGPAPPPVAGKGETPAPPAPLPDPSASLPAPAPTDASEEAGLEDPAPPQEPAQLAQDSPVCSEQDSFVPNACAEPTEPLPPRPAPARTNRAGPVLAAQTPDARRPAHSRDEHAQPAPRERLVDRLKLNCSTTGRASLAFLHPTRPGNAKPRLSLGCSMRLTDRLSFRGALIGYARPGDQQPWDPDYTYAFTYRVNDKLSLGYSNYSARFTDGQTPVWGLLEGKFRASYKLPPIRFPNEKTIPCSAGFGLPRPDKESLSLSCGYAVTKKLRISGTAYLYLPGEQTTYRPDYSYTASYRFNDDWMLSYNNYSNNRWPWNKGDDPGRGLTGGSLSLTYRFTF